MRQFRVYDMGKNVPTGLFANPRLVAEINGPTLLCALFACTQMMRWDPREVDLVEDTVLTFRGTRYEVREVRNGMEVVSLVQR